jgi:hypothetical protein
MKARCSGYARQVGVRDASEVVRAVPLIMKLRIRRISAEPKPTGWRSGRRAQPYHRINRAAGFVKQWQSSQATPYNNSVNSLLR